MKLPESIPTVVIVLDRPRTLAFTLGAMRRIKEQSGHALDDPEAPHAVTDVIGIYIWALLIKEDRTDLTVEDIWDLLHPGNLEEMTAAFYTLVGAENGNESSEGKVQTVVEESP